MMSHAAPAKGTLLNAFSVDVEGFIESNMQSVQIREKYIDQAKENREIETNVRALLALLGDVNVKATFFFLGRVGQEIPDVVKETAQAGHEIACHSYRHIRLFELDRDEFKQNLDSAKKCLEDLSGKAVAGFRAPDFSITESSLWALDVLKELGFVYDSSIYPFSLHDVYGIGSADPFIHTLPNGLVEFPMSTIRCLGRRFPFGGGGYFRLYPLFVTRRCLSKINNHGQAGMFYIHPYEAGPVIPRVSEMSFYRKFRHYYNCRNSDKRLRKVLQAFKFGPVIDVLKETGILEDK